MGKRENGCHLKMYTAMQKASEINGYHRKTYTVCDKANSGKQLPSQDVHSVANPLASERTAVISRCTQQHSRHAKRTAAIAKCAQYVSRQTVGNKCHHKIYTVIQIHCQAREQLPSQMYTATHQTCEKNGYYRKMYTECGKANSGKQLPSQDVHSVANQLARESTAVISRCTQQRSRHAKRMAAITRYTQYVARQTVGNSCHHKMYCVATPRVGSTSLLTDEREDPEPANSSEARRSI